MKKFFNLEDIVLGNAAGFVKTLGDAEEALRSAATRITIGSITLQQRDGNIGETYYFDPETGTSYNALGMPNLGVKATLEWLPVFHERCRSAGKELSVNIAGFSPLEYAELFSRVAPYTDRVEINAGCGNIWGAGGQKPVVAQHPPLLREVLTQVGTFVKGICCVGIKLSRVPAPTMREIASIVSDCGFIDEAVQGNTKTNQRGKKLDGSDALSFREAEGAELKHEGGMGGRPLKESGLREVNFLRELLPAQINVMACGAIETGQDLLDYVEQGAMGGQIGTFFGHEGAGIFSTVFQQADSLLAKSV